MHSRVWVVSYGLVNIVFSNVWWPSFPRLILVASVLFPKFKKLSTTCAFVRCNFPINLTKIARCCGSCSLFTELVGRTMSYILLAFQVTPSDIFFKWLTLEDTMHLYARHPHVCVIIMSCVTSIAFQNCSHKKTSRTFAFTHDKTVPLDNFKYCTSYYFWYEWQFFMFIPS